MSRRFTIGTVLLFVAACQSPSTSGRNISNSVTAAPSGLDFGSVSVGVVKPARVQLTSHGSPLPAGLLVHLRTVTVAGDPAFSVAPPASDVLDGLEQQPLQLQFKPAVTGTVSATLLIGTDSTGTPLLTVPLTGAGVMPDCDDGNGCTTDSFDPATQQCVHANRSGPCADGDVCTIGDQCVNGVCTGTTMAGPSQITAQLTTFAGVGDQGLVLGDGRLVFAHELAPSSMLEVTSVTQASTGLTIQQATTKPPMTLALAAGPNVFVGQTQSETVTAFTLYQVDDTGLVSTHGTVSVPAPGTYVPIIALGSTLYSCDFVSENLYAIDITNIDVPVLVTTFASPDLTECNIAVDAVTQRLFVSQSTDVIAFDVSSPLAPVLLPGNIPLQVGVLSAQNGVVAAAEWPQSSDVWLYDAADLSPLATISNASVDFLTLQDGLLWTTVSSTGMQVYDVSSPATPTLLLSLPAQDFLSTAIGSDSVILGDYYTVKHVLQVTRTPAFALTEVTGVAQGPLDSLLLQSTSLRAQSSLSAHVVDVSNPESPQWVSGALLSGPAALLGIGVGGTAPFLVADPGHPDVAAGFQNGVGDHGWADISDPNHPALVGSLSMPGWSTSPANNAAWAVAGLASATVTALDFSSATPQADFVPPVLTMLTLEPEASAGRATEFDHQLLSPDSANGLLAIAVDSLQFGTQAAPVNQWIAHLVDVSNPSSPLDLSRTVFPHDVLAIAYQNHVLISLEDSTARTGLSLPTGGDTLRVSDWMGPALGFVSRPAISLPNVARVLLFGGTTAFIGRDTDVAVVDVSGAPVVTGTLTVPEAPVAAAAVGNLLYIATPETLTVVSDPCPGN